jgi:hypothetical protein
MFPALRDVRPVTSHDDGVDSRWTDRVLFGKEAYRFLSTAVALANCFDRSFCQNGVRMDTSFRGMTSTFLRSISVVISLCPKKQMIGSNATAIVARMANQHSFWDRTVYEFPRKAVGQIALPIQSELSVANIEHDSAPIPTRGMFRNKRPEFLLSVTDVRHKNSILTKLALY